MLISGLQCVLQYHEQASDPFHCPSCRFCEGFRLTRLKGTGFGLRSLKGSDHFMV